MPVQVFKKLIDYFYTNKIDFNFYEAGWILSYYEMYSLEDDFLKTQCEKIVDSLHSSDWLDALKLGIEIGNNQLKV